MPRPRQGRKTIRKEVFLPEDLVARVEIRLFSVLEGRVPYGAWTKLLVPLLEAELSRHDREQVLTTSLPRQGTAETLNLLAEQCGMFELAQAVRRLGE